MIPRIVSRVISVAIFGLVILSAIPHPTSAQDFGFPTIEPVIDDDIVPLVNPVRSGETSAEQVDSSPTLATPLIEVADPVTLMDTGEESASLPAPISLDSESTPPVAHTLEEWPEPVTTRPTTTDAQEGQVIRAVPTIAIETSSPPRVSVGQAVDVQVRVRNVGNVDVQGLQLDIKIPENAELIETHPRPATQSVGVLRFDVGDLQRASVETIQLTLRPQLAGTLQVVTTVQLSAASTATIRACQPKLKITCEAPKEARGGSMTTFRLSVRNEGEGVAQDVKVTPHIVEPVEAAKVRPKPVHVGTLEPGHEREVRYNVSAIGERIFSMRFSVSDSSGGEAEAEGRVRVQRPEVVLATEGPRVSFLGRDSIFEIRVSNPGNSAADNVKVVTSFPRGMQLLAVDRQVSYGDSEDSIVWSVGRLEAQETEILQIKTRFTAEGDLVLETGASADDGLETKSGYRMTVISRPDLNIRLSNSDGPVEVGSESRFDVQIENVGSKIAKNVRVKVLLPPSLQPVANPAYEYRLNELAFKSRDVASGDKVTLQFQARGREAGEHLVRVILECEAMSHNLAAEESVFYYDARELAELSRTP